MLAALSDAIEARDPYTRGHSARVSRLAVAVACLLGWDDERLAALRLAGALHDIGKLTVPGRVLRKKGALTELELRQIRLHPAAGARLIGPLEPARAALPSVLYHHERWDGRGYPTGRAGPAIPEQARLLSVADAFDAMTSDRPYRQALPHAQALAELERCAGTQFDPVLVGAFLEVWAPGARGSARAAAAV